MGKNASKTIAIRMKPGDQPRKLTKVIGYGGQGFAVVMPYHRIQNGFLGKIPVDYNVIGENWVEAEDMIGFTAENRVKLSYHQDGFAQFSGEFQGKIKSGRDPKTGESKGVGLMTHPLNTPISSGPSFTVTAWGLNDFDELLDSDDAIIFEPKDMYFRNCAPFVVANGLVLEVFVFPKSFWSAVHKRDSKYLLTMLLPSYDAPNAAFEMKVLGLPNQEILLAGIMSCCMVRFPSKSGWNLGGPGYNDKSGKGYVLFACYPSPANLARRFPSNDREPPSSNPSKST